MDTISSNYSISLIGKNINELVNKFSKTNMRPDHSAFNFYKTLLRGHIKQVENTDSGVVRFHPTQLSFLPYSTEVINLNWLQFNQYDKIYFTVRRNIPDMIGSLFIAHTLKKFTYQDVQEVPKAVQPVRLLPNLYFQSVEMLLYSEFIMNEVKEYLTINSIEWEELDYEIIPKHIEEYYSTASTSHVETEYDYRSLVTNYNELQKIYEQLEPIAFARFCKDNTVDK